MVKWKRIRDFIVFTFGINLALVGIYLILEHFLRLSDMTPYSFIALGTIYMFVPMAVTIILVKAKYKEKLKDYGLAFTFNAYWILAWIMPFIILTGTIVVSVLFKFGTLDLNFTAYLEELKVQMGEELYRQAKDQLKDLGFILMTIQALVAGTSINALFAFGEEMGWRGFLYKELHALGFWKSSALIGVIWGTWHFPLILMGHNFPEHPYIGVFVMIIACIPLGILVQYVRAKTGSVFPAAIMHGMFNALSGYSIIAVSGGSNLLKLVTGVAGIIAMGVLVLVLFLLMKTFRPLGITRVVDSGPGASAGDIQPVEPDEQTGSNDKEES